MCLKLYLLYIEEQPFLDQETLNLEEHFEFLNVITPRNQRRKDFGFFIVQKKDKVKHNKKESNQQLKYHRHYPKNTLDMTILCKQVNKSKYIREEVAKTSGMALGSINNDKLPLTIFYW